MTVDLEVDPDFIMVMSPLRHPNAFRASALTLNERLDVYGTKMFPQLTMGFGRNYPMLYAPSESPVYFAPDQMSPALTKEQIKKKIDAVVNASALMKASGFAGVEVHAMHWGYLLDQFALSIVNKRTDEYGGTLENRLRAAKEIVEGIKQLNGKDFPVCMRLGLKSYIKGLFQPTLDGEEEAGRTLEEGIRISQLLESYGYDVLSVDVGIYDSFYHAEPPSYMPQGHVIDLAMEVKKAVGIPVLTGSRMNDPDMCERAVAEGKIDGVVLSRPSLADPYLPAKVAMGRPEKIRPCIGCNQGCIARALTGVESSCAVNPAACRELAFKITNAVEKKKVAVIGGGVAGMEAARVAKLRGHDVTLYEKSGVLGGNLIAAGAHSFKKEVTLLNEWYLGELKDLNVRILLNTEMTSDKIKSLGADAVVLTVGSSPVMPKVPGIDKNSVVTGTAALLGEKSVGDKVVVVGGGLVGCELAMEYGQQGKQVAIVEMLDDILAAGEPVPIMNGLMIRDLLAKYKVQVLTGSKLTAVTDRGVKIAAAGGEEEIKADTVVIAIGYKPVVSMAADLNENNFEIYETGDGKRVANILWAIWGANEIARAL
jgi:2-enoate reductase